MTIYTFSVLVTFDVPTYGGAASRYLDGTRTRCVVQACYRQYFPGRLSRDKQPRPTRAACAQLSVVLDDGEAEAFFAPGQRVTIWADAIVGTTIRGHGFVGSGVIESQKPSALPIAGAGAGRTRRTMTRPALPKPMAAIVHRPVIHRETVPQPHLGIDVSLAGRPR